MTARDNTMFGLGQPEFRRLIADTPADDPPGAIAATAAALAIAASLAEKCAPAEARERIGAIGDAGLELAIADAGAYRAWRDGDEDSPAVTLFPERLGALAEDLIRTIDTLPPHPVIGDTDLHAARAIAAGARAASLAVAVGNQGARSGGGA
jgi:hypothetical protein